MGGDFLAILCWDQDRFSRFDPLEANHYWFILRQAGVKIVTVRQRRTGLERARRVAGGQHQPARQGPIPKRPVGQRPSRTDSAENGNWSGSRPHYGFAVERIGKGPRARNGKLILGDPDQIATIKSIFDSYGNRDVSLGHIAKGLNDEGIALPAGKLWNGTTVQAIIRREAYTGRTFQFKESKGKFHTIQGGGVATADGTKTRRTAEWFAVECPRIIPQELWERCQAKLVKRRHQTSPNREGRGLLNGLLYCGHYGQPMYAAAKAQDSSNDPVYCC